MNKRSAIFIAIEIVLIILLVWVVFNGSAKRSISTEPFGEATPSVQLPAQNTENSFLNSIKNLFREKLDNEQKNNINYKRLAQETTHFIRNLKATLSYSAYKTLVEETDNFSDMDKTYSLLAKFARDNSIDLSANYPEINKYLNYIESAQKESPNQPEGEAYGNNSEAALAGETTEADADKLFEAVKKAGAEE